MFLLQMRELLEQRGWLSEHAAWEEFEARLAYQGREEALDAGSLAEVRQLSDELLKKLREEMLLAVAMRAFGGGGAITGPLRFGEVVAVSAITNANKIAFASGVLISENCVLTAGHVFDQAVPDRLYEGYLIGGSVYPLDRAVERYPSGDIALAYLGSGQKSSAFRKPAVIAGNPIPQNTQVDAVGFGGANGSMASFGVRAVLPMSVTGGVGANAPSFSVASGSGTLCKGDSGGPQYATSHLGDTVLLGITSDVPNGDCGNSADCMAITDTVVKWIKGSRAAVSLLSVSL